MVKDFVYGSDLVRLIQIVLSCPEKPVQNSLLCSVSVHSDVNLDLQKDLQSDLQAAFVWNLYLQSDVQHSYVWILYLQTKVQPDLPSDLQSEFQLDLPSDLQSERQLDLSSDLQSERQLELPSDLQSEGHLDLPSDLQSERQLELPSALQSEGHLDLPSDLQSERQLDLQAELQSDLQSEVQLNLQSELQLDLQSDLHTDLQSDLQSDCLWNLYRFGQWVINQHETSHRLDKGVNNFNDGFDKYNNNYWYRVWPNDNDDITRVVALDNNTPGDNSKHHHINKNKDQWKNNYWNKCLASCIQERQPTNGYYVDEIFGEINSSAGAILGYHRHPARISFFSAITKILKLLIFIIHFFEMGTSCSSNMYEHRNWSSMDNGSSCASAKHRKLLYFKRRTQSDPSDDTTRPSSDECTCQHHHGNNFREDGHSARAFNFLSNSVRRSSESRTCSSPNDVFETIDPKHPNNRMSANGTNPIHSKLSSRVVGSAKTRTTANCDVSPHRLLTRRTHSPNYRSGSLDYRSAAGTSSFNRQRSQSWSNYKMAPNGNFKSTSPSVRSSFMYPPRNVKSSPVHNIGNTISKSSQPSSSSSPLSPNKSTKPVEHCPECPMYVKSSDLAKLSLSKAECKLLDECDDDWTPVARQRAASESHTMRSRRHLPGTHDGSDLNQSQEHAHVHWADEEKGSSLSTSVFLSSVRPRSYSHGAVGSAPNRPILKKVIGL